MIAIRLHHADRRNGLDAPTLKRAHRVIERALRAEGPLTREELAARMAKDGIVAKGERLGYVMGHAELEALIVSGPRRGKQFTYALLDERAPAGRTLNREAALAELARRYFTSHGPARATDFAWWSGLTVKDARAARGA